MTNIKISIIVPIYNMERLLDRCFSSLREISLQEVEFILVNDGSKDNSEAICQNYVAMDSRFIYKSKPNGGVSSARNLGYSLARGKYIAYVDSDDYINPEHWSNLFSIAETHQIDILNFGYSYVKDDQIDLRNSVLPKDRVLGHTDIQDLLKMNSSSSSFLWFPWSNLFRKTLIDEHQITFKEGIKHGMEDTIFILECYLKAKSLYSIGASCYYYVFYAQSLTQKKHKIDLLQNVELQFQERLKIQEKAGLTEKPYLLNISRHYMEHTFFGEVRNLKNGNSKEYSNALQEMRDSQVYRFALKHYHPSQNCTAKMRLIITFFKYKFYSLIKIVH